MPSTWFPHSGISRRLLNLVLAVMLAAATLVFAQGAPALAEDVPTAKNPGWPEACGVDIVMVFDTSNSILPDDGADMEAAGKSFVDSLTGTPSRVAVTYFRGIDGLGGNGVGGTQIGWTDISNTSGANAVKGAIDSFGNWGNWEAQGGTNWEDGFNTTDGFGADIVLFMTDGNPTTYNNNPDDLGSTVDAIDIDKGVAQANDTKSLNTRVVAVGIGSNISVTNLQRISGPTVNDDYFLADGFGDLENILPKIALELCQGTVTVKKLVDGKPAAGWSFNATDQATKITGNDGLVNFDWSQSSGQSLEVTITENLQNGYVFDNAVCKEGETTLPAVAAGGEQTPGVTFTLDLNAIVTCTFDNSTAPNPQIAIDKVTNNSDGPFIPVGDAVTWTYTVTNPGNVPLANVTVTDNQGITPVYQSGDTNSDGFLDPTETWIYEATGTATAGQYDNVGEATGDYGQSTVTDTDRSSYFGVKAQIAIDKVTNNSDGPFIPVGDAVTWTYTVTNPGNVSFEDVAVTDDQGITPVFVPGGDTNGNGMIDPGETWTYEATGIATIGRYDNVGKVTGSFGLDTYSDTDPSWYFGSDAGITIVKTADGWNGSGVAGDTVDYTFTVTNTGNVTLTGVTLDDPQLSGEALTWPGSLGSTASTLKPGESVTGTGTYTLTQTDINAGLFENTASTEGNPPVGEPVTDTDTEIIAIEQLPLITIVKDAVGWNGSGVAGDTVDYTFTVTNTGNVTLTGVTLDDPQLSGEELTWPGSLGSPASTLLPGESVTGTGSYTLTQADINAGFFENTASTEGTPPSGPNVTDTDTEIIEIQPDPAIDLVKTGTLDLGTDGIANPGDLITYTFEVTNTGNVSLYGVNVTDPLPGLSTIVCDGGLNQDSRLIERFAVAVLNYLAPGGSMTCSATYPITQDDIDTGYVVNLATASGVSDLEEGVEVTDTDPETVPIPQVVSIDIEKATNGEDADTPTGPEILVGDPVTWTYVVTNPGNVSLTGVSVTDDQGVTPVYKSGDANSNGVLEITETWIYEATGTAALGEYKNTGTVDAYVDANDAEATDSDLSHYVGVLPAVGDPLTIDKLVDNLDGTWVDVATYPSDQTTVTWQITLANTAEGDVFKVMLTDAVAPSCETALDDALTANGWTNTDGGYLPGGESVTFECTEDLAAGAAVVNVAIANGVDEYDRPVPSVQDDATVQRVLANASIGDTVWADENENGVQDNGEKGIAGATVRLTLPDASVVETTTNSNGLYLFSALDAGTYTVEVVLSSIPKPSEGDLKLTTAGSFTIQLADEQSYLDADFGVVATLPKTGLDTGAILGIALALLLAGAVALLGTKRRKEDGDALA